MFFQLADLQSSVAQMKLENETRFVSKKLNQAYITIIRFKDAVTREAKDGKLVLELNAR